MNWTSVSFDQMLSRINRKIDERHEFVDAEGNRNKTIIYSWGKPGVAYNSPLYNEIKGDKKYKDLVKYASELGIDINCNRLTDEQIIYKIAKKIGRIMEKG